MDFSLLKLPVRGLEKIESLQQLRERLLTLLLQAAFILATVLYVIALIPVFQKGLSLPPLIYTVLYIWLVLVAFVKGIPYRIRAGSWAIFFYLLGVVNLSLSGLNVDSGVFFLSYVLMTVLLFDLKQGLLALGVSAISMELFGYAIVNGYINLGLGLPQTAAFLWVIGGTIFVMASLLLIVPLTVLLRGLVGYLEKSRKESEELEKTNQALRSSEERYRSLVEISPDLVTLIDLDGKIIVANPQGLSLFDNVISNVIGKDYLTFIAPSDQSLIAETFQKTLETGSVREIVCQCVRRNGTLFEAEFSTSLIRNERGEAEAVIAVGRDITVRRNVERSLEEARQELETRVLERTAELRSASERLKQLVSRSPTIIYASGITEDYPVEFVSENVHDLLGYTPDQFTNDPLFWHGCIHPEDVESILAGSTQLLETGETTVDYRYRHKSGEYRWMRDSVRLVRSPEGQPVEMVGVWTDITAQKQAEESQRILLENSIQGILVFQDNKIVYINPAMIKSLGYEPDELKSFTSAQIMGKFHPDDHAMMWQKFWERKEGDSEPARYEVRVFHKNGEIRQMDFSTVQILYNGKPAIQLAMLDLTEHKRAEQALRESEETARVILNATDDSLLLVDRDEVVMAVNQTTADRLGKQPEELIGKSLRELYSKEATSSRSARFASMIETGEPTYHEDTYDGRVFDVKFFPVFDDYGQVARAVISASDVTERRKMEEALRESEKTARVMMDAIPSSMALIDSDGAVLAVNKVAAGIAGTKVDDLIGRNAHQVFPDDQNSTQKSRLEEVFRTGQPGHFEDLRQGRWQEIHIHPIQDEMGRVGRVVVSAIDLTEHKKMERALRESEQTLRAMINATPSSLTMVDKEGTYLAANNIAAERLGVKLEEMLGRVAYQFFPEEVVPSRKAYVDDVFQTGRQVSFEDFRGGYCFENHIHPVVDEDGQVRRVVVSSRDMTERKQMEQALRESEEAWRIMMNTTPSALGMMDLNGRLLAANKSLAEKLGRSTEEVLGKTMFQLLPEESARLRKAWIDEVFRTGEPIVFEDNRQGVWFENHIYPIKNDKGEVIRVVFSAIDLTERMRIEQALKADKDELEARVAERTSELMESREQLRVLTTDVVNAQEEERRRISRELHDEAGQALVSMKYSLETILADLPRKEQPIRERLTTAIQQLDQTMDEIRFLAHSLRPPLLDIADLDLTLRDYCQEFSESTKLHVDYAGEPIPRLNDLAELAFFRFLQEALTNVVKHAQATQVRVRLKTRGRYLSLLVLDNGKGKKLETSEGQGHLGIQERFRILNGQVRIRSSSETGFIISTRIPYLMELDDD